MMNTMVFDLNNLYGALNNCKNFSASVAEPEPHHFSGAGAATRCGSDGSGSKPDAKNR
jgi:hypothetical protein